jgi:hypothetical protein
MLAAVDRLGRLDVQVSNAGSFYAWFFAREAPITAVGVSFAKLRRAAAARRVLPVVCRCLVIGTASPGPSVRGIEHGRLPHEHLRASGGQ